MNIFLKCIYFTVRMGPNPLKVGASGWFDDHNSLILNSHSLALELFHFFSIWTWILAVTWVFSLPRSLSLSFLFSTPHAHPNCFGKIFHKHESLQCADSISKFHVWLKGHLMVPHIKFVLFSFFCRGGRLVISSLSYPHVSVFSFFGIFYFKVNPVLKRKKQNSC